MDESHTENADEFGKDFKIIIVGNTSTGKTSILHRYMNQRFEEKCRATISGDFSYKIVNVNGVNYRLQFWDLPGQQLNPLVTSIFVKDSNAIIFCCEVNNEKSRKDILIWESTIQDNIDLEKIPKILVENKCDLLSSKDKYNEGIEELKQFSDSLKFSGCFRTSALNGYNIENAMNFLINEIINTTYEHNSDSIILDNKSTKKKKVNNNRKCC